MATDASARQRSSWHASKTSFEAAICFGQDKKILKFQKRQAWQRPKFTSGGGTRHASEWRNSRKPVLICSSRQGITQNCSRVRLTRQKVRRNTEIRKTCQIKIIWRRLPNSSSTSRLIRKKEILDYLCGMTIICCWFFADFAGCKLDGRIVIVFVAGFETPLVLSISVPIILFFI